MKRKKVFRIAWSAALLALCGALIFFNLPAADGKGDGRAAAPSPFAQDEDDLPAGHLPGQRLPDFTLPCMDGSDFVLRSQRGKVVVINLWATWCTPCVHELPHFDRLQREYPDSVAVLAIHSDLITDDVAAYLAGFDYGIAFAVDASGETIRSLGGSAMLPQTVILNARGEVTYNKAGSLTYEALLDLVRQAMDAT